MRTLLAILALLVTVSAFNLFGKDKKPVDYCQDKDPEYCAKKVPTGFCESSFHTKAEIKEKCMKSCKLCCGDKDPEKCKELVKQEDYCTSSFKTRAEIKEECGESCGLCKEVDDPYGVPVDPKGNLFLDKYA
ncbi:unnamed protein product [Heligmosomoides polygyrus]|uniref:ShKT domain-containing protein n=1 Tax=Heligmosomoides polygyrus TaxID=6339 RepID=A0A183GSK1_HELPZ|nr:unnamed protein product [Heligmosomoides polygyrus]